MCILRFELCNKFLGRFSNLFLTIGGSSKVIIRFQLIVCETATSVCDVLLVANNLQPINIFPDHSKQGNFPNCPILTPVTF